MIKTVLTRRQNSYKAQHTCSETIMFINVLWWIMVPKLQPLWYLLHLIFLIHPYKTKYCHKKCRISRLIHLYHIIINFRFPVLYRAWFSFIMRIETIIFFTIFYNRMFFVSSVLYWVFSVKSASPHPSCNSLSILLSQVTSEGLIPAVNGCAKMQFSLHKPVIFSFPWTLVCQDHR